MEAIMEALKGTPWWVYIVFAYLLSIGIRALRPQVVRLKKIFLIPIIFILWSLYGLVSKFKAPTDVGRWLVFLSIGALIGWWIASSWKIKADKQKLLIQLPGGPTTLILILLIFSTKYAFGYLYETDPSAQDNFLIYTLDVISSGVITGMFVGRALCYLRKFKAAPHTALT